MTMPQPPLADRPAGHLPPAETARDRDAHRAVIR
jgi:hypothetical protein